jgi:hypothetical protein
VTREPLARWTTLYTDTSADGQMVVQRSELVIANFGVVAEIYDRPRAGVAWGWQLHIGSSGDAGTADTVQQAQIAAEDALALARRELNAL